MSRVGEPAYQAFRILQVAFVVAPILAGLDKFFNLMTNWSMYLSPFALKLVNYHDHGFMMFVGAIEIIVGIGILYRPRLCSYVVFLWLLGIIVNLVMTGTYYDIALRDLGLALAALSLARLSKLYA